MQAQCLCGSVKVTAREQHQVSVCHCGICRRWGGGPLFAVHCGQDVQFEGREFVTDYSSSEWANRGFCRRCGTHLYYHLLDANEYILPAGLFQDEAGMALSEQIFIDQKPAFYNFREQTNNLTEAEVFAKYAPAPDNEA